jgi:hypothetical protein
MPKLTRSQASGYSVTPVPNAFWDGFDSEKEDEMEYAARKLKEELALEAHKTKILSAKVTNMSLSEWASSATDSDEEDW